MSAIKELNDGRHYMQTTLKKYELKKIPLPAGGIPLTPYYKRV